MGMVDKIRRMMALSDDVDYEEEDIVEEEETNYFTPKKQKDEEPAQRSFFSRGSANSKTVSVGSQIQVVLVKPSRFEDVTAIADHLNEHKTVVLNLEMANRETSRRLIDFLSGTAYAQKGSIKKVAHSTYIITPSNVDVLGDLILDDIDSSMYFE